MTAKKPLWHYTAPTDCHLGKILESGVIKPSESNASLLRPHAAPDVAWFLDRPLRDGEHHGLLYESLHAGLGPGAQTLGNIKQQATIRVSVPEDECFRWIDWVKTQPGYEPGTVEIMAKAGGGMEQARAWWVVPREVPQREWVEVIDHSTGTTWTVSPFTGQIAKIA